MLNDWKSKKSSKEKHRRRKRGVVNEMREEGRRKKRRKGVTRGRKNAEVYWVKYISVIRIRRRPGIEKVGEAPDGVGKIRMIIKQE